MIAHNLLGTKRDITATAAAAAAAEVEADADRDTTAAITVVDTNLAGGNRLVVRVASPLPLPLPLPLSRPAQAVPQFMLLKLSHGQLYSALQIIARAGPEKTDLTTTAY